MHMKVNIIILLLTVANLIPHGSASIFNDVHQMMVLEGRQSSENIRFVYSSYLINQFCKGKRASSTFQGPCHQNTVGRGPDTMALKQGK